MFREKRSMLACRMAGRGKGKVDVGVFFSKVPYKDNS